MTCLASARVASAGGSIKRGWSQIGFFQFEWKYIASVVARRQHNPSQALQSSHLSLLEVKATLQLAFLSFPNPQLRGITQEFSQKSLTFTRPTKAKQTACSRAYQRLLLVSRS
jgi:hypothetical protein